jgi:uncharacterized membrane protein
MESATYGAMQARTVDAGRGVSWWSEGWALFIKNAGMWVVMSLIFLVISIVLSVIPILGGLALALLFPVFIGGWMMAARKLETGGALEVADLFAGFKGKLTPLVVLGGIVLGATIIMWIVIAALGVGAAVGMGSGRAMGAGFFSILLALLIGLSFGVLVGMAMWFSPALVVFHDMPPVDAIKASFSAGLKNIIPFLVFGVLYIVAAVIASIPFGLGWLVLIPVLMLTMYSSYKDVFGS